jgi:murein DD-endopeptidase MepM/ murein hydrolase activator NlpD
MHEGIDFGARIGTPIYAAGDGVVQKASWFSSYGNFIKIQHNANLGTAYGHLSRYASGIRPGVRVKQGQVIGYVGTTGRSTGPHLHYEVHIAGRPVNPLGVKVPTSVALAGRDKVKFTAHVLEKNRSFANLRKASNNQTAVR